MKLNTLLIVSKVFDFIPFIAINLLCMGMMIAGVAACQALDSSGEVLDIKNLDISSLEADGLFNLEHQEHQANQILGKILKAKKIFSAEDCSTKQELKHWNKLQVPFLWVVGELFDDVGHSGAQDLAAMIRYDEKWRAKGGYPDGMRPVVNFSVQGGKLEKQGNVITHSLARKISCTVVPCNKIAEAEEYKPDAIDNENKSSSKISDMRAIRSQMFKFEEIQVEELRKDEIGSAPSGKFIRQRSLSKAAPAQLGITSTGRSVKSTGHHLGYSRGFTANEHKEAANLHYDAAMRTNESKQKNHHLQMAAGHTKMMGKLPKAPSQWSSQRAMQPKPDQSAPSQSAGLKPGAPASRASASPVHPSTTQPYVTIPGKGRGVAKSMNKAMTAGNMNVAPSSLTGGAALQKQVIEKTMKKTVGLAKAEEQASAALSTWQKAESFKKFLAEARPEMTPAERTAFTRLFALYRVKKPGNSLT